jgi:uncharacterized small protein (DUF1192 family)
MPLNSCGICARQQRDETIEETPMQTDDDAPRRKISHEIGQDLSLLSVDELSERVTLLRTEIDRLEAAKAGKQASRSAADRFFKS